MPDDDRIPRALTGAWRRVLRSLQGRQPAERTASTVVSALAATLRSVHGVPGLPGIAAQMQDAAQAGLATGSWIPASDAARRHIPTRVAERAAAALVGTLREGLALVSPDSAAMILAERVVRDLAYTYGLDRIAPVLLAEGRYDTAELRGLLAGYPNMHALHCVTASACAHQARNLASALAVCSFWRRVSRPRGASARTGCGYLRTASVQSTCHTCDLNSVPRRPGRCIPGPCGLPRHWRPQSANSRSISRHLPCARAGRPRS
jgi:hypothetical protein